VIADTVPPAVLGVARLAPWRSTRPPDVRLDGPAATPSRALAELADATFVEIHSHGMVDVAGADASFLMLSPESDGRYALTAAEIRTHRLRGRPIVILAACHAAATANHRHESWSLPAAFVAAGARAVIASTGVIDDDDAGELFDDVRTRIERGEPAAIALRDARAAWMTTHPAASWVRSLIVFQ
jgi:CHAT domain-containing protein